MLFVFLYSVTVFFYFFFCKLLKFNDVFFSFIFSKLKNFFILNEVLSNNITNSTLLSSNQHSSFKFKNLYKELNFFNTIFFNNIQNTLVFLILTKKINKNYLYNLLSFNFISFLALKNNTSHKSIRKINLNYFSNVLYIIKNNNYIISNNNSIITLNTNTNYHTYTNFINFFKSKTVSNTNVVISLTSSFNNFINNG
jgi:hypothetical protein